MTITVKTAKPTKATNAAITKDTKAKTMKAIGMADLLTGETAMKKAFASIHGRGQSLQRDVHIAACSVLQHLGLHSDIRMVSALFLALPESYRTNALRDWFAAYGPLAWEQNKPVFVKGKAVELVKAMSDPFWKFKPEPDYVPADVQKLIDGLIKKLTTDQDKVGTHHGPVIAALEAAKSKAVTIQ